MKRGLLGRMRVIDGREAGGVVCDCAHDHAESITNKVARPAFRRSRAGEGSFADCFAILHKTLVDGCAGFLSEDQMDD